MAHWMVDELTPQETMQALAETPDSALTDVRTRAELAFVGVPDISATGRPFWAVEWLSFGAPRPNPAFIDQLVEQAGGSLPGRLFFICRSGSRSMSAAQTVAAAMDDAGTPIRCTNVAEGFEGDLNGERHRGQINGWKARGLPWVQN